MNSPIAAEKLAERQDRIANVVIRVGVAYWFVFSVFIGAMVFAMFSSWIGVMLPKAWGAVRVRHTVWVIGAVVTAIGFPLGIRPTMEGFKVSRRKEKPASELPPSDVKVPIDRSLGNAFRSAGGTALIGLFGGFLLGGTLAVMWLSLSMGPLAPAEWARSVHTRVGSAGTQNPIPVILWFGTMGALGVFGFFLGLIGAPLGWVTDGKAKWVRRIKGAAPVERK